MALSPPDPRTLHGLLDMGGDNAVAVVITHYAGLIVVRGDDVIEGVPFKRLRCEAADATRVALLRTDRAEWRLLVRDVAPDSWVRAIKPQSRLRIGKAGSGTKSTRRRGLGVGIAAGLLVVIGIGSWAGRDEIIAAAAPLLPHSVTDEIGRSYLAQMGRACDAGPGNAALTRLTAKLAPVTLPEPLSVRVVDNPEINAVALPGGHVALYSGLIDQAKSSDEVAAALAHEIEHVAFQHPNQNILRDSGPAVIARTLDSDAGKLADLTVLKKGTKAAEAQADDGAITLLGAANISTRAAADFFDRQGSFASIFDADHPSDRSRARRFAGAMKSNTAPAMSTADWQALRAICTR